MGGFFGVACKNDCVGDLFYGTDYHSHLGTKFGGMAVTDKNGNICLLMHDITLHARGGILGAIGYTDEEGAFAADFWETEDYYEDVGFTEKDHIFFLLQFKIHCNSAIKLFAFL